MPRNDLARVVRSRGAELEALAAEVEGPLGIEDLAGRQLFGEMGGSHRFEVSGSEGPLGVVVGGPGASVVVPMLRALHAAEAEKLALASETLGRYKELTLLYDMSDALSRVLDVEEVAGMVVNQAARFLRAGGASLFIAERRGDPPRPLAVVSASPGSPEPSQLEPDGVEQRVLTTGRAELADTVLAAPLRSGERVFGVLRVSEGRKRWSAGDVKLVTSMAANAASAISHALLHRDQLREQALRAQIERYVSPELLRAAVTDSEAPRLAVLYGDLGALARSIAPEASADDVVESYRLASSIAVDALLATRATVNVSRSEMLIACFLHPGGFEASARAAVDAAKELGRVLEAAFGVRPGFGVAAAGTSDSGAFLSGVGAAAMLESMAHGRVWIDAEVAREVPSTPQPEGLAPGVIEAHEVKS
ncbi:MAG: GAF domain-containing protein [Sandaracinaceae bacterium]